MAESSGPDRTLRDRDGLKYSGNRLPTARTMMMATSLRSHLRLPAGICHFAGVGESVQVTRSLRKEVVAL